MQAAALMPAPLRCYNFISPGTKLMVRAVSLPFLLIFLGVAALQAQQPRPATPLGRTAAPQPQVTRSATMPVVPRLVASTPRVVFRDGLLTVHAHNTNLADVLNAIQRKTGASFEFPNSAAQEAVAVDLGPAPPHDVLASLLNGSRFDYIVLGRQDDPNEIATVMLQEKTGANGAPAEPAPVQTYQAPEEQEQPEEVPADVQDDQQAPPAMPEDQNTKTPEQMLEELKQMQNQQNQQQQQQQIQQPGQPVQPGLLNLLLLLLLVLLVLHLL